MQELIKIESKGGIETVNAKELYLGLGLDKSNWSRWLKENIENNDFFKENVDWVGFVIKTNGNETKNYYLSIDMAKNISMTIKNELGHKYRNYFIECERKLKQPMSLEEMTVKVISGMTERIKLLENKVEEDKPKVEAFETFIDMKDLKTMKQVSGLLNVGRNKLFNFLRTFQILDKNNEPYRKFIEMGLFEVKIKSIPGTSENITVTLITTKGIEYIRKHIEGYKL